MSMLGNTSNDEKMIKAELFYLLSLFILTFEHRQVKIKNIIIRNKHNFEQIITDFKEIEHDDENMSQLLDSLMDKLNEVGDQPYN